VFVPFLEQIQSFLELPESVLPASEIERETGELLFENIELFRRSSFNAQVRVLYTSLAYMYSFECDLYLFARLLERLAHVIDAILVAWCMPVVFFHMRIYFCSVNTSV